MTVTIIITYYSVNYLQYYKTVMQTFTKVHQF